MHTKKPKDDILRLDKFMFKNLLAVVV